MSQITEDEWEERFHWMPDEDGECNLLEDTPEIRQLLRQHDPACIWSQIDSDDSARGAIVAGMHRQAIGYYLCEVPRKPDEADVYVLLGNHDD